MMDFWYNANRNYFEHNTFGVLEFTFAALQNADRMRLPASKAGWSGDKSKTIQ